MLWQLGNKETPLNQVCCCQTSLFSQDTCSGSSILANARLWGVQIVHVDGILLCYAGIQGISEFIFFIIIILERGCAERVQ